MQQECSQPFSFSLTLIFLSILHLGNLWETHCARYFARGLNLGAGEADPSASFWYSGCTYGYSAQRHLGSLLQTLLSSKASNVARTQSIVTASAYFMQREANSFKDFFLLVAAWVSPGRSALQSAKQRCYVRNGHNHNMMSYIIFFLLRAACVPRRSRAEPFSQRNR